MLNVSATAKQKLKEALRERPTQANITFRILRSSAEPKRLEIGLDKQREGDQVVESDEGMKVLLIGANLASELDGLVFDYQDTPQGTGFTVTQQSGAR